MREEIDEFNDAVERFHMALAEQNEEQIAEALAELYELKRARADPTNTAIPCVYTEMCNDCTQKTAKFFRSKHAEALERLVSRTRKKVHEKAALRGESDAQRRHVQMLTSLFGEWSDIIQDMHNTGLNQEALQLVVRPFHTRVSEVSAEVLEKFRREKNLSTWETLVRSDAADNDGYAQAVDLQGMDSIIDQMAYMCAISRRYNEFLQARCGMSSENEYLQQFTMLSLSYVSLEDMYLIKGCKLALDDRTPLPVEPGVFALSGAEDCFFIIQKVVERSLSTFSEANALSIANRVTEILHPEGSIFRTVTDEALYAGVMAQSIDRPERIHHSPPGSASGNASLSGKSEMKGFGETTPAPGSGSGWIFAGFNSSSLALSLVQALEEEVAQVAPPSMETGDILLHINTLHLCKNVCSHVRGLYESASKTGFSSLTIAREELSRVAQSYEACEERAVRDLVDSYFDTNLVASLHREIEGANYNVSSTEYEAMEDDGPISSFITKVLMQQQALTTIWKEGLTEESYGLLLERLSEHLTDYLLEWMMRRKFSEWGAMLLERELRAMSRWLQDSCTRTLPLGRLTTALQVLTVDKPADATRLKVSALGEEQIRGILRARAEFKEDVISRARFT